MKSTEFIFEGDDKTVDDVKKNHPEIYEFFKATGAWMAFDRYGKVEAYNTAGSHMVVVKIQPSAGLENTKLNIKDAGMKSEVINSPSVGKVLSGSFNDVEWNVSDDGRRGNITETWRFALPHKDDKVQTYHDRTMEGSDPMIQVKIAELQSAYRAEMVAQNNRSSAVRSYAAADKIAAQIKELERQQRS